MRNVDIISMTVVRVLIYIVSVYFSRCFTGKSSCSYVVAKEKTERNLINIVDMKDNHFVAVDTLRFYCISMDKATNLQDLVNWRTATVRCFPTNVNSMRRLSRV